MTRRALWVLVTVLLLLVLGATALVWLFNFGSTQRIDDRPPAAPPSADQVARGAYLARVGDCMLCHTERGGPAYAGGRPIATPFGTIYSSNLTPDADTGLGRWSAAQFRRALHEGRSRSGRLLYPVFPYPHTTRVSDADADALFDYLRSLPPVNKPDREHRLRWPYSTQAALAVWRVLFFRPEPFSEDPAHTPEWNRGAYLVQGLAHCGACHTSRNALGGVRDVLDLSGGLIPMQNWYAPSLAAPNEAGVQQWSIEDIVKLLGTGTSPRATVSGPMGEVVLHSLQYVEPADLRAIAVYLKSVPPAPSDTDPREVPRAALRLLERGGKIYSDNCAQCHGERGEGVPNAYPALAGNRAVTMPTTANLVQIVLNGGFPPATRGNPRPFGMPPFAATLSDADVAAVVTYIRSAWSNRAAPVSELDVAEQRSTTRD
jgi:mono/diheme cytochrome c family protein